MANHLRLMRLLKNRIQLIDATCPVVLNLQNKIKEQYLAEKESQILIFGKPGHAEVVGLQGQTDNEAIVITSVEDLQQIDTSDPLTYSTNHSKSGKIYSDY